MISEPKCGWCNFKLGDFIGRPSGYMTNVIQDLLDVFINFYKNGASVAVFDEEGSYFTLLLTYNGIYIIEEKEKAKLFDFSELDIYELANELINDIESDFDNWVDFAEEEGDVQFASVLIYNKVCELKDFIRRKAL